jgi:hypothetical protein
LYTKAESYNLITSDITPKPFFFILGRPRSGTTLLRFLFDAHPDVCIPFEGKVIWDMFIPFSQIQIWNEDSINNLVEKLLQIERVEKWGIDVNALKNTFKSLDSKPEYQVFIKIVYQHYKSEYDKNTACIFGDKNPTYSLFPGTMLRLIQDAKIIYLVRDPRDHIISMKKARLGNGNIVRMAIQWKIALKDILNIKVHNPESVFILKYEDLVSEPEKKLQAFCDFLGIQFNPVMLNFYFKKDKYTDLFRVDGVDERFHSKLFQPVTPSRTNRWKTEMNPQEIALIELCVRKLATHSGYEISDHKLGFFSQLQKRILILITEIKVIRHHRWKNNIILSANK